MDPDRPPHQASDGIVVAGLHKSYGDVHAVAGVDLHVRRGETVALLGPNGAGKSTTIDMLLGLAEPDEGSVSLFGMRPVDAVASGAIGAMLQTGSLLQLMTVREMVTLVASLYPHPLPVDEALSITGLADLAERRTERLSGGESQRVRFAMAIVADPDLLVLDEPTVALDVEARRAFWASMRAFARTGKTVLFATHYLEEADAFADRIVVLARGTVVADGPGAEIKARVGTRTIRAIVPGVAADELSTLPGVVDVEVHGETAALRCADSDAALRALLARHPDARDLEVRGASLEDAFFSLTEGNTEAGAEVSDA